MCNHNHFTDRKHEEPRGKSIFPRSPVCKLHTNDFFFGNLTPHLCFYPLCDSDKRTTWYSTNPYCKELLSWTMSLISEKRKYYGGNTKKWTLRTPIYKSLCYTSMFWVRNCNNQNSWPTWKSQILSRYGPGPCYSRTYWALCSGVLFLITLMNR